jgi:hypothetical protein
MKFKCCRFEINMCLGIKFKLHEFETRIEKTYSAQHREHLYLSGNSTCIYKFISQ